MRLRRQYDVQNEHSRVDSASADAFRSSRSSGRTPLCSMQTSPRPRENGGGYLTKQQLEERRRGHTAQISISDDNHHVTEAIGDLYGDNLWKRDSRPLSFLPSLNNDGFPQAAKNTQNMEARTTPARPGLAKTNSNERVPHTNGQSLTPRDRKHSFNHGNMSLSPPPGSPVRSPSDTATSSFPLNDIDYESNPAAVAQELSNLQALRRMSMDVNAAGDPDLPSFSSAFGMPTVAPTGSADEDDTSRLFWVPARIHPELAPTEFKTFLDSRVDSIKRRSSEFSLSPDDPQRKGSGGSLRRKKSMLSRQIDNTGGKGAEGYQDGAEKLDRKRSLSGQDTLNTGITNLRDLEVLVNDRSKVVQKLSLDTGQKATGEVPASEDMPILPSVPPGSSLRRSTRTTYRRGSLRKGERVPLSKRVAKTGDPDTDDISSASPITPSSETLDLVRVSTDPTPALERPPENFSRPGRMNRNRVIAPTSSAPIVFNDNPINVPPPASSSNVGDTTSSPVPKVPPVPRHFVSQIASNGRSTANLDGMIPKIIETPPPSDETRSTPPLVHKSRLPERVSSHEPPPTLPPLVPLHTGSPLRGGKKPGLVRQNPGEKGNQTLREMAANPSPLPGNSTRTDSLSFIPTLMEEKKTEPKKPASKKDGADGASVKKSSWSWGSLLGNEEKEKERRKEEEAKEAAKRAKLRQAKAAEKDNTRLDVLQTTMDGGRGRESLVLDRENIRLEEERKKESSRKSSGSDTKKEKESGLFSTLFGGGKKKNEREYLGKKHSSRNLSPDPPHPILKPDLDYAWSRFSILEERAIYRMAHIKLANPRRALYSQVLLSNFMYSYLAKVQQMHPQIQIPQTAAQKAQQRQQQQPQAQPRRQDQPEEFSQYQRYQEQQQQQDLSSQPPNPLVYPPDTTPYIDDAQTYNHDHGDPDARTHNTPSPRGSLHSTHGLDGIGGGPYMPNGAGARYQRGAGAVGADGQPQLQQQNVYQYPQSQFEDPEREEDDDMW